jgi:predicted  nucleic acid-binding Zn-ribbon protein
MSEEVANPVELLFEVSQLDQRIARVIAQRRQQLGTIQDRSRQFDESKVAFEHATVNANAVRDRYDLEQKEIRADREKLKARRKALSTFNNHKVQQGALVEIERSERLISAREESLFSIIDSLDEVEALEKQTKLAYENAEMAVKEAQDASRDECLDLETQFKEARKERDALLKIIPPNIKSVYDQVYEKFPADPVVRVAKNHCSGCYMTVPPQTLVDMTAGKGLAKCRGCGRLLAPEKNAH